MELKVEREYRSAQMKTSTKRSLIFGLLCSPVGVALGVYTRITATGDYSEFPYFSSFSSFIAPTISWYFLVEKRNDFSRLSGAKAGCAAAVSAHYITWYTSIVVGNIQYWIFGMRVTTLDEVPIDVISGLLGVLSYTLFSLVLFGWLTLPAGALIGSYYAKHLMSNAENGSIET